MKSSNAAVIYGLMLFFLLAFDVIVILPKMKLLREYEKAICFPPPAHD